MKAKHYQIIIVGGGMVGACSALMCSRLGLDVAVIEANPPRLAASPAFDQRAIALSATSIKILEAAGLWSLLNPLAAPIEHIHVSDQGHYGQVKLHQDTAPLGQVLTLEEAATPLWQALEQDPRITLYSPARAQSIEQDDAQVTLALQCASNRFLTISGELLIACDGTFSNCAKLLGIDIQRLPYHQSALIANLRFSRPKPGWAFERFTAEGPLALLPLTDNRWSLVWCGNEDLTQQRQQLSDAEFKQALQQAFGYRMGTVEALSERYAYPLALHQASHFYQQRAFLLGNAAHTLHPIAGQGFNLGLRGIAWLVEFLRSRVANNRPLIDETDLQHISNQIAADFAQTSRATHALVRLYSNDNPLLIALRGTAAHLLARTPLLLAQLADFAKGQRNSASPLACGIPLSVEQPSRIEDARL